MERFPEQHDLISFFECEPKVLDPGISWAYNHLEFHTVRGGDDFLAIIEPGGETFRLRWRRDGRELVRLDLERVCRLDLELTPNREILTAGFRRSVGVFAMKFQLKPEPHIEWGVLGEGA
jgi:hypothetical protein